MRKLIIIFCVLFFAFSGNSQEIRSSRKWLKTQGHIYPLTITDQNITSGATVYVGGSTGQYNILLYLDTFRTGEIANSNIYYVRSSQANTEIAIIGRKK